MSPEPIPIWAAHVHRSYLDEANETIVALRAELAAYRAQPFVPLADHARVKHQRDDALVLADQLTRELANLRDKSKAVALKRLTVSLAALVRQLERVQGYSTHEQQAELREARALLVEVGK